jgi:hypothetical protein
MSMKFMLIPVVVAVSATAAPFPPNPSPDTARGSEYNGEGLPHALLLHAPARPILSAATRQFRLQRPLGYHPQKRTPPPRLVA